MTISRRFQSTCCPVRCAPISAAAPQSIAQPPRVDLVIVYMYIHMCVCISIFISISVQTHLPKGITFLPLSLTLLFAKATLCHLPVTYIRTCMCIRYISHIRKAIIKIEKYCPQKPANSQLNAIQRPKTKNQKTRACVLRTCFQS